MDAVGLGAKVPRTADDQHGESRVSHVIVYVGTGMIREAMMSGTKVEEKSFQQRFGVAPEALRSDGKAGGHTVFFGTFF